MVVDLDLSFGHLVETLVNNSEGLSEFLDSAQVSIVAVSVLSDRHVEFDLVVCVVRGDLSAKARRRQRIDSNETMCQTNRISHGTPDPRSMTPEKE